MRLLVYGLNYAPELTGIGKYTSEMAEWFARQGHEVRVVTAPPYYPQWKVLAGFSRWIYQHESLQNVGVLRCPLWVPAKPSGLKRILHLASFSISSMPVMLAQVFWRPDVVIVIEPPLLCAPIAALTAFLSRAKSLLHIQDFEVDAAFELGLLRSAWLKGVVLTCEKWIMRRFDKVSTISGRMLQRLSSKGVTDDKQIYFPNWVNTELIYPMKTVSPTRNELGFAHDDVVLLYSGNMGQKQGLELIVDAARLLASELRIRFVMCGEGAAYEALRTMATGLQNITWQPLQPLERLNELLNMADIHLLPQRADAADLVMPSKLTGILASGRPVIATATEGQELWSAVEGRGINVVPGNVDAFVSAIKQLVDDTGLRAQLGVAARHYAESYLCRDIVLKKFESELKKLTD